MAKIGGTEHLALSCRDRRCLSRTSLYPGPAPWDARSWTSEYDPLIPDKARAICRDALEKQDASPAVRGKHVVGFQGGVVATFRRRGAAV